MKVITDSKCCDTIRLEDVDLCKHYVVLGHNYTDPHAWITKHNDKVLSVYFSCNGGMDSGHIYKSLKEFVRINSLNTLHAFNTLHEMLDFVKENTPS